MTTNPLIPKILEAVQAAMEVAMEDSETVADAIDCPELNYATLTADKKRPDRMTLAFESGDVYEISIDARKVTR